MRICRGKWPALICALWPSWASAQDVVRGEIHPISTRVLTTSEFLLARKDAPSVTIAGELRLPNQGTDKLPAVVIVHGAGGLDGRHYLWAKELNGIGLAVFLLDTFTGRGIAHSIDDQTRLSALAMLQDTYRALELLRKHPRIDPDRIAVMGFSKGGASGLYSSLERFQTAYAPEGKGFAAYITFYTGCIKYIDDERVGAQPIRIYHGEADTWVSPTSCRDYVARLKKAGRNAEFVELPGALHAFDNPGVKEPTSLPQAQGFITCNLEEKPQGTVVSIDTGQPFGPRDPCLKQGVTVGFSAEATAAAQKSVKAFLVDVLKVR